MSIAIEKIHDVEGECKSIGVQSLKKGLLNWFQMVDSELKGLHCVRVGRKNSICKGLKLRKSMKFLETDKAFIYMARMPNMVGSVDYNDGRKAERQGADKENLVSYILRWILVIFSEYWITTLYTWN